MASNANHAERFAPYRERGDRLLSTAGLYNQGVVDRICAARPNIPKGEFAEDNPETVVFNFLAKLVYLADQVGTVAGSFYLARIGQGEYPLADLSRVSTHLVNLTLHPALDPLNEAGREMLAVFATDNESTPDAVFSLVHAVMWLRATALHRYQAFNAGQQAYVTREDVWTMRDVLDKQWGSCGMFVAACAQQANLLLGLLQNVAEAGQLETPGDCNLHAPQDAETHQLQAALNLAARLQFGAKGAYLDWPLGTEAGDVFELEEPVQSDENGVLWRWDGAALIPLVTDQATTTDALSSQWQGIADRLRADDYPIALVYHPLV